jgi:hypothetical protein
MSPEFLRRPKFKVKGHQMYFFRQKLNYVPLKSMQPGKNSEIAKRCTHSLTIRPPSFKFFLLPKFKVQRASEKAEKFNFRHFF